MRIAYITMQFPAPAETFAALDIRTLSELGHNVSVYSMRPKHSRHSLLMESQHLLTFNQSLEYNSLSDILVLIRTLFRRPSVITQVLKWITLHNRRNIRILLKSILLIPVSLKIALEVETQKPDIVHLFWGHYPTIPGFLIKKINPLLPVTVFLGAYDLARNYGGTKGFHPMADHVFTHSFANMDNLQAMGISPKKISVVHRGVQLLTEIGNEKFSSAEFKLVFAGRLMYKKGCHQSIELINRLSNEGFSVKLFIAGEGDEKKRLKRYAKDLNIQDKVVFLGYLPQTELFKLFESTQILLLPSSKPGERLPNVVKEGMARKNICVVLRSPGIDELISHGMNGFIVDSDFVTTSHEIISQLMVSPRQMVRVANEAFSTIQNHFDVKDKMLIYQDMWKEIRFAAQAPEQLHFKPTNNVGS